ncbi:NHL repeat [Macleaya cordata]|uniref:NHL repeat n=1 Tax=Macleaya cordata TaxID=56857 RepID=A0A200QPM6_MACCD|nr:NHL repeat [Macleaya cordata]
MRNALVFLIFLVPFITLLFEFQAEAAPAGPLIKHISSFLKWTRSSPKTPQTEGNVLQFENGYLVETVVEGNELGVVPHSIRVSQEGELFAVDAVNSNIVRITPPLSQYSRARLVAGSFQGYTGHVDGKPSEARFNHPKGVTMDDKGNVYVADTSNLAIRKIGESGVTTIAGGKSNTAGYRDGPSEHAKFSSDFDVVYVGRTCSLLVVDRGNAALRQISLNQEDCDHEDSSISTTADIFMVIGAILVGYATCMIQQGFKPSIFSWMQQPSETEVQHKSTTDKSTPLVESLKEDLDAGWPSFGRLLADLSKLAAEALGSVFLYFIPFNLRPGKSSEALTPIKDSLVMPEDKAEPPLVQKQRSATPLSETRHSPTPNTSDYTQHKLQKSKSANPKDPSWASKHRSSKKQDFMDFYGSGEAPPPYGQFSTSKSQKERGEAPPPYGQFSASKTPKERTRHRHRDRSGEVVFGAVGAEPKPVEVKPVDYSDPKFDRYNIRSKYSSDDLFNY